LRGGRANVSSANHGNLVHHFTFGVVESSMRKLSGRYSAANL
jgi:hypothetical protein